MTVYNLAKRVSKRKLGISKNGFDSHLFLTHGSLKVRDSG